MEISDDASVRAHERERKLSSSHEFIAKEGPFVADIGRDKPRTVRPSVCWRSISFRREDSERELVCERRERERERLVWGGVERVDAWWFVTMGYREIGNLL